MFKFLKNIIIIVILVAGAGIYLLPQIVLLGLPRLAEESGYDLKIATVKGDILDLSMTLYGVRLKQQSVTQEIYSLKLEFGFSLFQSRGLDWLEISKATIHAGNFYASQADTLHLDTSLFKPAGDFKDLIERYMPAQVEFNDSRMNFTDTFEVWNLQKVLISGNPVGNRFENLIFNIHAINNETDLQMQGNWYDRDGIRNTSAHATTKNLQFKHEERSLSLDTDLDIKVIQSLAGDDIRLEFKGSISFEEFESSQLLFKALSWQGSGVANMSSDFQIRDTVFTGKLKIGSLHYPLHELLLENIEHIGLISWKEAENFLDEISITGDAALQGISYKINNESTLRAADLQLWGVSKLPESNWTAGRGQFEKINISGWILEQVNLISPDVTERKIEIQSLNANRLTNASWHNQRVSLDELQIDNPDIDFDKGEKSAASLSTGKVNVIDNRELLAQSTIAGIQLNNIKSDASGIFINTLKASQSDFRIMRNKAGLWMAPLLPSLSSGNEIVIETINFTSDNKLIFSDDFVEPPGYLILSHVNAEGYIDHDNGQIRVTSKTGENSSLDLTFQKSQAQPWLYSINLNRLEVTNLAAYLSDLFKTLPDKGFVSGHIKGSLDNKVKPTSIALTFSDVNWLQQDSGIGRHIMMLNKNSLKETSVILNASSEEIMEGLIKKSCLMLPVLKTDRQCRKFLSDGIIPLSGGALGLRDSFVSMLKKSPALHLDICKPAGEKNKKGPLEEFLQQQGNIDARQLTHCVRTNSDEVAHLYLSE